MQLILDEMAKECLKKPCNELMNKQTYAATVRNPPRKDAKNACFQQKCYLIWRIPPRLMATGNFWPIGQRLDGKVHQKEYDNVAGV